ncbi:phosphate ABC transporter permease PstA [Hamadaea tsunoensis]|uniref:phosphate ABC transporter permease PstA n=1 Tax=Hamadaea tsunoensis TaxID=53368 RepID=UPI0003FD9533|nr:phosphate ABC transporter permease PstA [Hamadaea tsunoensis]
MTPDLRPRRRAGAWRTTDVLSLIGAAATAAAMTWLLYARLAPFSGVVGMAVIWYGLFLACYAVLVGLDESGPAVRDRVAAVAVHGLALLLLSALAFIVAYTFWRGWPALRHLNFYFHDMSVTSGLTPLDVGGIIHGVVGTLIEIGMALAITVPLGLLCSIFLSELPGRFTRFVRTIVEAMTALPSIVAGLFIYAAVILTTQNWIVPIEKSGFAASLAISVMMLPIIIRASDVVLRLVPGTLKEASYALGATQWRTVWHVVLPTARSGLTTAVILGTARGIGETSPVLLTAGYTASKNLDPFHGPMPSLPLLTYTLIRFPESVQVARGFGSGAVLMFLVLLLFGLARMIGGRPVGQARVRRRRRLADPAIWAAPVETAEEEDATVPDPRTEEDLVKEPV